MRNAKGIAKQVHRTRALAVLEEDASCRWLANKPEILDELGRIDSDHALLVIAKRLCELKPTIAQAIEMIRRHREFDQLADEVVHVVNDYRRRHPATTRHEVLRALETAAIMLGRVVDPTAPGRHQFLRNLSSTKSPDAAPEGGEDDTDGPPPRPVTVAPREVTYSAPAKRREPIRAMRR